MTRTVFRALLPALALIPCSAWAQTGLVGRNRYPQFRSMGVLPGNAVSLMPDGRISSWGAVSHSTPIAYSFGALRGALSFDALSTNLSLASPFGEGADQVEGNGTAGAQVGIPLGSLGDFTASWMILSELFDNVGNAHFSPRMSGPLRLGVGAQDYWGNGGRSGEGQPDDWLSSTSWYGVATYDFQKGVYASFGLGSGRFSPAFGSISAALSDHAAVYAEHDSFNLNFGVRLAQPWGVRVPSGWGRDAETGYAFINLGVVAGKYTYWGASVAF
jgi:hypothetical protein